MPATLPSPSRRVSTFDGLSDDVVNYCLEHSALATARRGELLIQQGEPARLVYVIKSGYAKFLSTSPDGHEVLVGIAGPFDVFGQAAATEHLRAYLVTATALTPMELVTWSRAKALELANRFPEIHSRLDAQMIANLDLVLGRLHTVSEGHVPQRLTRALLELAERHGREAAPRRRDQPAVDAPGPGGPDGHHALHGEPAAGRLGASGIRRHLPRARATARCAGA